jgi:hypothetical protein
MAKSNAKKPETSAPRSRWGWLEIPLWAVLAGIPGAACGLIWGVSVSQEALARHEQTTSDPLMSGTIRGALIGLALGALLGVLIRRGHESLQPRWGFARTLLTLRPAGLLAIVAVVLLANSSLHLRERWLGHAPENKPKPKPVTPQAPALYTQIAHKPSLPDMVVGKAEVKELTNSESGSEAVVLVQVPAPVLSKVNAGQKTSVHFDKHPDEAFWAKVDSVMPPSGSEPVGSVIVKVPDNEHQLTKQMIGIAEIQVGTLPTGVAVPCTILRGLTTADGGRNNVANLFVVEPIPPADGSDPARALLHDRQVKIGHILQDICELRDGLNEGERYLTADSFRTNALHLQDGSTIEAD